MINQLKYSDLTHNEQIQVDTLQRVTMLYGNLWNHENNKLIIERYVSFLKEIIVNSDGYDIMEVIMNHFTVDEVHVNMSSYASLTHFLVRTVKITLN